MKGFYAFQFSCGRSTTTGSPNGRGRMATAGFVEVFKTKKARDEWVAKGRVTSDMAGNCREAVTRKEVAELKPGYFHSNSKSFEFDHGHYFYEDRHQPQSR